MILVSPFCGCVKMSDVLYVITLASCRGISDDASSHVLNVLSTWKAVAKMVSLLCWSSFSTASDDKPQGFYVLFRKDIAYAHWISPRYVVLFWFKLLKRFHYSCGWLELDHACRSVAHCVGLIHVRCARRHREWYTTEQRMTRCYDRPMARLMLVIWHWL